MTSIWDDPELHTGENYFSFDHPGDTLQGRIEIIKKQVWADGTSSPQLFITDATTGQEVVLSAGQIQLKTQLVNLRPEPGDDVWIQFTRVEPRGGGKTLKHFEVRVKRNNMGPGYRPQTNQQPPQQGGFGGGGFGGQPPAQPQSGQQYQPGGVQPPQFQQPQPQAQPGFGGGFPQTQPQAQPPAQPAAGQDPWGNPGQAAQQTLPADDPWATSQQPATGYVGEPPF